MVTVIESPTNVTDAAAAAAAARVQCVQARVARMSEMRRLHGSWELYAKLCPLSVGKHVTTFKSFGNH
jgi:hypothetical protein